MDTQSDKIVCYDAPGHAECLECGEPYLAARAALGHALCLRCGEHAAVMARRNWTVAPLHKSNYTLVTDPTLLTGINVKQGR